MAGLTLCRSIILDSGELVAAGTTLKDYGDLTSRSIAPSQPSPIDEGRKKIAKNVLESYKQEHLIDFFRIPRECVSQSLMNGSLKKKYVKGDESVAPFPCFIRASEMCEERSIELIENQEQYPWNRRFFDKNFNEIDVFIISSLGNFYSGSLWKLGNLKSVSKLGSQINTFATVIGYYYSDTDFIKVEPLYRRRFYVKTTSYLFESIFNELSVGQIIRCYSICEGRAICKGRIYVFAKGDNKWFESFRKAHLWLNEDDYQVTEEDSHIFIKFMYYDGGKYISRLTIIHKSSNPFLFFHYKNHMVLIKDDPTSYL